jgi:hypothetical protein
MQMKSVKRFLTVVPLAALLLGACANNRATEVGDPNSDFYLALPRIELSVDANGVPSLANVDPNVIRTLTGGSLDLSAYAIPKDYVDWLTSAGVQHMEIVHKGDGLFIFVNNKPMPHVGWNGDSIATVGNTTADVLGRYQMISDAQAKTIKILAPFLRRLGVDLAVRFPLAQGSAPIELRPAGGKIEAVENKAGDPLAQARLVVTYDGTGVPSVAGLSTTDVEALVPGMSMAQLNLDPTMIKTMTELGIQHISLRTDKDGLLLGVNDKPLPSIVWNDQYLANGAELFTALNTYPEFSGVNDLVKQLLPSLQQANVELALRFPLAPGAQKVPSAVVPNL